MSAFIQLSLVNFKMLYRNIGGLFWTIIMPLGLYVALSILPIPNPTGQVLYRDYVLPGILSYAIMSGGIYGLAYWMTDMKARGVIKRFLVTPLRMRDLILALLASRAMIMVFQVILITIIGILFFGAHYTGTILGGLILILLGGGIFLLIGLLISSYATSYESAAPLTAAVGMPFILLGNVFFPTNNLPHGFKIVSDILPITYLADGLRACFISSATISTVSYEILILAVWFLGLLALAVKVFRLKE